MDRDEVGLGQQTRQVHGLCAQGGHRLGVNLTLASPASVSIAPRAEQSIDHSQIPHLLELPLVRFHPHPDEVHAGHNELALVVPSVP